MAKQLYWSIQTAGSSSSSPPAGLGCLLTPESLLIAYVSDNAVPDAVILDSLHADVLKQSVVRGRRVADLICKLITASYNSVTSTWELIIEYDDLALADPLRELTACDICQVECLTCDAQSKLTGGATSGVPDTEWNLGYAEYLATFTTLGPGLLPDITPP